MRTQQALAAVDDEDPDPTPAPDRDFPFRLCPLCRGRGRMEVVIDRQRPRHVELRPCILCRGQGYVRRRLISPGGSSNTVRLMKGAR
jgi:hypothetical protein